MYVRCLCHIWYSLHVSLCSRTRGDGRHVTRGHSPTDADSGAALAVTEPAAVLNCINIVQWYYTQHYNCIESWSEYTSILTLKV